MSVNTWFSHQLGGQVLPSRSSQSLGQHKTQCNTHVCSLRTDWSAVGTVRQADMTGSSTGEQSRSTGKTTQSHLTLRPHGLYSPWNSPGQNTGAGSRSLLWGSSQPRDRTQVSCIAGEFFTSCIRRGARGAWQMHGFHTSLWEWRRDHISEVILCSVPHFTHRCLLIPSDSRRSPALWGRSAE